SVFRNYFFFFLAAGLAAFLAAFFLAGIALHLPFAYMVHREFCLVTFSPADKLFFTNFTKFIRGMMCCVVGATNNHAPNLSNINAFACMWRIKNFASNTPSEPRLAPVSVKRSNLSLPL